MKKPMLYVMMTALILLMGSTAFSARLITDPNIVPSADCLKILNQKDNSTNYDAAVYEMEGFEEEGPMEHQLLGENVAARRTFEMRDVSAIEERENLRKVGKRSNSWWRHRYQNSNGFLHPWYFLKDGDAQIAQILGNDRRKLTRFTKDDPDFRAEVLAEGKKWKDEYSGYSTAMLKDIDDATVIRAKYLILQAAVKDQIIVKAFEEKNSTTKILLRVPEKIVRDEDGSNPRFVWRNSAYRSIDRMKQLIAHYERTRNSSDPAALINYTSKTQAELQERHADNRYRLEMWYFALSDFAFETIGDESVELDEESRLGELDRILSDRDNFSRTDAVTNVKPKSNSLRRRLFKAERNYWLGRQDGVRDLTERGEKALGVLLEINPEYDFDPRGITFLARTRNILRTRVVELGGFLILTGAATIWTAASNGYIQANSLRTTADLLVHGGRNYLTVADAPLCGFTDSAMDYFGVKHNISFSGGVPGVDLQDPAHAEIKKDWNRIVNLRYQKIQGFSKEELEASDCNTSSGLF